MRPFASTLLALVLTQTCAALLFSAPIERTIPDVSNPGYELRPISLPGANGKVSLDYCAYDRSTGRLWVPASNTGFVDVIDDATGTVSQVGPFPTDQVELHGRKVVLGPTSVSIGERFVYIGNRGDSTLCAIDSRTIARRECLRIAPVSAGPAAAPDAVVYVAVMREVWVTTGAPPLGIASVDKTIQVFDASDPGLLKPKIRIALPGSAEGYAVDNRRGVFYTNIEETRRTLAIDVRQHKVIAEWDPGATDLQGLALDHVRRFLFVACADHVVMLDAGKGGRLLDSINTGGGLDNIDYDPEQNLLYAAASLPGTLTIAKVEDQGKFHLKATIPTAKGARGVIAAHKGAAYLIDPLGGRLLKLTRKS
jgi:DNA-binding beta-propeller fold protein YncE